MAMSASEVHGPYSQAIRVVSILENTKASEINYVYTHLWTNTCCMHRLQRFSAHSSSFRDL